APGAMLVGSAAHGAPCRYGGGGDLPALRTAASPRPAIATAWCGAVSGAGSPIVTTTDGTANPIVWMLGAEGDNRLYGFRGDTGERLFVSPPLAGLRHFQTLIAADDRLFCWADSRPYARGVPPGAASDAANASSSNCAARSSCASVVLIGGTKRKMLPCRR